MTPNQIDRAVNLHDELVAVLRRFLTEQDAVAHMGRIAPSALTISEARAVLAKAEAKP